MALIDFWTGIDDATTTSTKTIQVPSGHSAPAGSLIVVSCALNAGLTSITGVSDGRSNTYGQILSGVNGANSVTHILEVSKATTTVQALDNMVFTLAATRLRFIVVVGVFDDVASATADGATATGTATSVNATAGPTGDPATSRALVLGSGATQSTNTGETPLGGQALVGYSREGTSSGERSAWLNYSYVASPGTQTPACTLDVSSIWVAGASCFDAAVAAKSPVFRRDPSRGLYMR